MIIIHAEQSRAIQLTCTSTRPPTPRKLARHQPFPRLSPVRRLGSSTWPDPALATRLIPWTRGIKFLHDSARILSMGAELDADSAHHESDGWPTAGAGRGGGGLDGARSRRCWSRSASQFQGGTSGCARFIAVCPPDWKFGVLDRPVPARCRSRPARCAGRRRRHHVAEASAWTSSPVRPCAPSSWTTRAQPAPLRREKFMQPRIVLGGSMRGPGPRSLRPRRHARR